MDLASKITAVVIGVLTFALGVAGIIYRLGKTEERMVGNINLLAANMDAKIEALKVGQADNRAKVAEVLEEVKAHTQDGSAHVNQRFEELREKRQDEFREEMRRKVDAIIERAK